MSKKKCIMVGVGGMAGGWIQHFWPPFSDRMEFAALVDVNRDVLNSRGQELGLPSSALFTDVREAFERVEADFCCIVTPPAFHREAVELACARKLDILSEKPIADTWDACCAIYKTVRSSGVKMLVTQNYRYTTRILTLKRAVAELGTVNYAIGRYASDYRVRGSWGNFRHEIPHTLLVEGGIHHLDQLRNLCEANVSHIAGWDWSPGHIRGNTDTFKGSDSFDTEPCASYVLKMTNGTFANYEGNNLEVGKTNSWHSEYYRVECEGGAATLDKDHVVRIEERGESGTLKVREVPNVKAQYEGHVMMPFQFLEWLDGGPTPPTALEDNIQSNAAMFAAIQASETNSTIDVQEFVKQATG
ncbi:MAG: hypothetical protein JWN98_1793 [Abditibacteriota bacterium]|nr:hypothetical protein [Abditibacteriota bacterium]